MGAFWTIDLITLISFLTYSVLIFFELSEKFSNREGGRGDDEKAPLSLYLLISMFVDVDNNNNGDDLSLNPID